MEHTSKSVSKKLFKAAQKGSINDVKEHLKDPGCDPNALFQLKYSNTEKVDGWRPLQVAANNGHSEIVQILLDNGAGINMPSPMVGSTPLHQASARGHVETIDVLVKRGASMERKNTTSGATPLHVAAMFGSHSAICKLIKTGADVHATTTRHGATSLHIACAYGQYEAARTLLQHGARVGAKNNYCERALHLSAWYGHSDITKLLILYAADATLRDEKGRTAKDCVKQSSCYETEESRHDVTELIENTLITQDQMLEQCLMSY